MSAKKSRKLIFRSILIAVLLLGGATAYFAFFKPNIYLDGKKYKFIYVPTKASYEDLVEMLEDENIFENKKSFEWMAQAMNLILTPRMLRLLAER